MNRATEQALTSLIPRHPGPLPPELIELAGALLAQSRQKASNLKADEDIARTYACANIACERLKTSLNLPQIEPRPPCPPRVYTKLYAYLDGLLARRPARLHGTPSRDHDSGGARRREPLTTPAGVRKSTPTRSVGVRASGGRAGLDGFRKNGGTGTTAAGQPRPGPDPRLPAWIAPLVRHVCGKMASPAAIPHVLAGVTTIITHPAGRTEQDTAARELPSKIPAMIGALWFFVMTRLTGKETSGKEYLPKRDQVVQLMRDARREAGFPTGSGTATGEGEGKGEHGNEHSGEPNSGSNGDNTPPSPPQWHGWTDPEGSEVDQWLVSISADGWLEADWFVNIRVGDIAVDSSSTSPPADLDSDPDDEPDDAHQRGGMLLEHYDYLSPRRRLEYRDWKRMVLSRVDALLAEGVLDDLDE